MAGESVGTGGRKPGRRERKKHDTRRRILRAAFDLFKAKGFEATTVEEIAEAADVAKGTVFNYFPQKTAFLVAAYREWWGLIREELGPVESWEGPVRDQLSRVHTFLTDLAVENRRLARQVIFENMRQTHLRMVAEDPDGGDGGTEAVRETGAARETKAGREAGGGEGDAAVRLLEDMTGEVIRRGMERGEVLETVEAEHAASLIASATFHTLVRGLVEGGSARDIEESLSKKMDIILAGIAP